MRRRPQASSGPGDTDQGITARERFEPAALLAIGVLAVVWSWWAVDHGAFFGTVFLPGAILLCATAVVLSWVAPWRRVRLRRSRAASVGIFALVALGAWAALSAIWSPAPDLAIADAQRIWVYALSFLLGIWTCNLLGTRIRFALVPLAVAAAFAGVVAVITLLHAESTTNYLYQGTLDFPLGYRNANGAFFFIAFWPALGLASDRDSPWPLRALALGTATLCLDFVLLSQSRGSLLAGAAALCVYLILSRERARALAWLFLAAAPAALVVPPLADLYRAAHESPPGIVLEDLHAAARAVALTSALAVAIGALGALLGRFVPASPRRATLSNRAVSLALVLFVVGGSIVFVERAGDPLDWLGQRVSQFRSGRTPSAAGHATRFSLDAGTSRGELWRVALLDAREHPLLGDGAGGYRYTYLRERRPSGLPQVRDAHSVELENLAELGVPGLVLFSFSVIGLGAGALRAREFGPAAASLSVAVLAAATYWLVHASLDWFWPYPAVTAPVFALLGAACAPCLGVSVDAVRGLRRPQARRWGIAGAAALLAVSAVPPFLSQRYVEAAYATWRSDISRAYDDLDRAHALNALSVDPLLAKGAIARANGDRGEALESFREAVDLRPEEWASYYFLAQLHRKHSPRLARKELAAASNRNPHSPEIAALREKLESGPGVSRK
jgi:tetratricopeptide (TPR) repeat protein